jgi:diguanylate cyclase (GGDEF)-like protein
MAGRDPPHDRPPPILGRLSLLFAGVLLLCLAPMAGLLVHVAQTGRADQVAEAQTRLLQAARFGVAAQHEATAAAERLLAVAGGASLDWAEEPETCLARLQALVGPRSAVVNAAVMRRSGRALCTNRAADEAARAVSLADRPYFQLALQRDGLSVGSPVASRFSGEMMVPVALRLPGAVGLPGDPPAVLAAALDLGRLAKQLAGTQDLAGLAEGGVVMLLDTHGRLLLRHPADPAAAPVAPPYASAALAAPEGVLEADGLDGVRRLVGFAHATEGDVVYVVSVRAESITSQAEARFRDMIALAAAAAMIGLALAYAITRHRVLAPMAVLTEAAQAVEQGAMRAIPSVRLPGEFEVLRRAMAAMLGAVCAREDSLHQANRELERLAGRDALTGLANRRAFDRALEEAWRLAQRQGDTVALAIVDIDHFKKFNDRYGHPRGDDCLRKVAEALASVPLRERDLAARLGGEEFALLLPATDSAGAAIVAQRALAAIRERMILHEDQPAGIVTASVGVAASRPLPGIDPAALIAAADAALYRAKESGRDRVVSARDVAEEQPVAA